MVTTNVNPCCMPLKVGVKIVTHLSMALAVAVGCMGIRLISISSEVTNNPPTSLYYEDFHYPIQQKQDDDEYDERLRSGSGTGKEIFWKPGPFRGLLYPEDPSAPVSLNFPRGYTNLRSRSPKTPQEFFKEYAKVLLICGLMAICAVFFQFLTSFLLLCFINREEKAYSQIWVAVNCSVLFCLATCLVLFLCEGTSIPVFSLDEKLFLSLITTDTLLSIYFLWVVMAFI